MNLRPFRLFRIAPLLAATLALALPFAAHATSITYNLTGVGSPEGTLTGTVSIDSVTDLVTAADITFNDAAVGNPVFTNIGSPNAYNGLGQDYISGPTNSPLNYGGQIALYYDTANIASGGDLAVCIASGQCGTETNEASLVEAYVNTGNGGPFDITSGSLDPAAGAATTPEPPSLLLLGTGLCTVAGIMAAVHGKSTRSNPPDAEPESHPVIG
jgi:hypothetical protein